MAHGLALLEFARIFALAHRRMIVRNLPDLAALHQVERESPTWPMMACPFSSIASVSTQAIPFHSGLLEAARRTLVVGQRDRFANALFGRTGGTAPGAHARAPRDGRRPFTGSMPAMPSTTRKTPRSGIHPVRVLVVVAYAARIAPARVLEHAF